MDATPSPFSGKKILITGINGFLGSHLSASLQHQGAHVEGISRNPMNARYLQSFPAARPKALHELDLRDYSAVNEFLRAHSYDVVFHLASQADTWKSSQLPLETFETNMLGTLHLMESLRVHQKNTPVILSGSVRAFEYTNAITRGAPPSMHLYDASKFGMEMVASSYFHTYGMPGAIAQNTNMYGPNDLNFNRLIPKIMQGICLHGYASLRGNGQVKRDFMFVGDAVQGMESLAARVREKGINGNSFTFASGGLCSIREVAEKLSQITNHHARIEFDNIPLVNDRDQSAFAIDATTDLLGWKPLTALDDGLKKTLAWYRNYFHEHPEKGGNP